VWVVTKSGERRFVYTRITSVRHRDGYEHFIILTDITQLKEQEARLREGEERFRLMAENIQDGVIIVEDGEVVFANRRITEITGYSPDDLSHMKSAELVTPEDRERLEELVARTRADTETVGRIRVWIRRKDRARRCILSRITSARHGETLSTYITMTDITGSMEREEALRFEIERLRGPLDPGRQPGSEGL